MEHGHIASASPNQEFTVHASMYGKACLRHGLRRHSNTYAVAKNGYRRDIPALLGVSHSQFRLAQL